MRSHKKAAPVHEKVSLVGQRNRKYDQDRKVCTRCGGSPEQGAPASPFIWSRKHFILEVPLSCASRDEQVFAN